jgi:hypothetical protein
MSGTIPFDYGIVVSGKDMFGAEFIEKTRLLELSENGFSFLLYRPMEDGVPVSVNFHPDSAEAGYWVKGVITKVASRLDGQQTVEVRVLEFPQTATTEQTSAPEPRPCPDGSLLSAKVPKVSSHSG